jgi:hypothetical protein
MIDRSLKLTLAITSALLANTPAYPQAKCDTVLKCAQTAVEAATSADAAAKALQDRVSKVEALIKQLESQSTGASFYQCPEFASHGPGSIGGGSWGFYGCQGQITTQSTCSVIEFPSRKDYSCTPVGKLRIVPPS